jgi:hypothetical protein
MKSALQTVSQELSRPDSDLAIVPVNIVIQLPQTTQPPIPVHNGQTVQWQWDNNFSVKLTSDVLSSNAVKAELEPDGLHWKTPPLRVVGPRKSQSTCIYTSLPNAGAGAADPPPPPPPNVIIVDNSGLK